ncbi:MAG: alpha/beta hydrolase [bacterium]|nr:alpha/beta hydrolase [bacterium]MDT8396257.1 alpha/beta hydrolase [bacterium]
MTSVLTGTLILFCALLVWVRWQERANLFFPSADLYLTPADLGLTFKDVRFGSAGNTLHGWYIPGEGEQVVLWLHGNAGNVSDRADMAVAMNGALGVSSFLFDYRGYGRSSGRPTEKGLYEDAAAAFRWLAETKGIAPGDIFLYGHSLGSVAAVDLALGAGKGAGGLVLESPFTGARDIARMIYAGLPVDLFMSLKLDNVGRVGKVAMPVLVIHGEADGTIPFEMGRKVFEAAAEPKRFLGIPGADHSDCYIVGGENYWSEWKKLLDQSQR